MNEYFNRIDFLRAALKKQLYAACKPEWLSVLWALLACLVVVGCKSTTEHSPAKIENEQTARVLSTNAVPIEIEDDHVFVRGTINGHDVRLIIDTGATHVLVSPETAAAIGIRAGSEVGFFAFGTEKGSAKQGVADSVVIGPAISDNVPAMIMPIPSIFGADGLLGLSFLRQFSFRLDYEKKLLCFAPSESGVNSKAGLVSQKSGHLLTAIAKLDGIPARLVVDTGAGQSLILHPWFVERQKLRQRYPKRLNVVTGGGILGLMRGELARVQTLQLGTCSFTNVFVEFSSKDNALAGETAGYIGSVILRRFTLVFDAASQRMSFEPNSGFAFNSPTPACVRAGLVCFPTGPNWIVRDVVPESPAAEAGVRLGDRLLEIDGKPIQSLKFVEIKNAFRAEPGTRVRLRLQTGEELPREAIVILRNIL